MDTLHFTKKYINLIENSEKCFCTYKKQEYKFQAAQFLIKGHYQHHGVRLQCLISQFLGGGFLLYYNLIGQESVFVWICRSSYYHMKTGYQVQVLLIDEKQETPKTLFCENLYEKYSQNFRKRSKNLWKSRKLSEDSVKMFLIKFLRKTLFRQIFRKFSVEKVALQKWLLTLIFFKILLP